MNQTVFRPYTLIFLLLFSFASALIYSGATIHQLKLNALSATLEQGAASMNQFFANRLVEMSLYAEHDLVQSMNFERMRPLLLDKLKQQQGIYEKFIIGTPEGHFYNTAGGNPHFGGRRTFNDADPDAKLKSIAQRDYWQQTVGNNQQQVAIRYISNPMISFTTGVKQVVVAASIINQQDELVGLIGGSIDWNTITQLIADTQASIEDHFPANSKVLLVSDDGHYWYHWDAARIIHYDTQQDTLANNEHTELKTNVSNILNEPEAALSALGTRIIAGGSGYSAIHIEELSFNGYAFYAPLPDANYSLAIFVDDALIHTELLWLTLVHALLLGLTLFVGGYLLKRTSSKVKG